MQERFLELNIDQTRKTMKQAGIERTSVAFVNNRGKISTEEINVNDSDKTSVNQPSSTTIYGAASLSKPVFAYLILKLIESGKYTFDLNTKLNDILPFDQFCTDNNLNWDNSDNNTVERVKSLNVKMVLSHTTGFNIFKKVPIKSQFEPGKGYVYSNLAMFYLQKVIETLVSGKHDLILMISPPNDKTLNSLPIKSNTAYLRCNDQLFYVNKEENICREIKIDKEKLKKFDEELKPTHKARSLSETESKQVLSISDFTPSNLLFQMLAKTYVFDLIKMNHSLFYQEYELSSQPNVKFKHQPQTLYLKKTEAGLNYEVIGLNGQLVIHTIPWNTLPENFPQDVSFIIKHKEKYLPMLLAHTARAGHTTSPEANAPNSLYTTAEDYALFVKYWLKDVNKMMQDAFHDPVLFMMEKNGKANDRWGHAFVLDDDMKRVACGLGWDLETNEKGEVIRAYKTGDMNQWRGQVAIDFEKNTVIVYFSNSRNGHILADQIITPNVELKHGHNYFYNKFGFARKIEKDYTIGLMSETSAGAQPVDKKIYIGDVTEDGVQVGVKGLRPDNQFETFIVSWVNLPVNFPKNPLEIIEWGKKDEYLPTLLLEGMRVAKIDGCLDVQYDLSSQTKNTAMNTESFRVSNHSIFSQSQDQTIKDRQYESGESWVLRKKGG